MRMKETKRAEKRREVKERKKKELKGHFHDLEQAQMFKKQEIED